ncbi:hypothetical protein B0H17DRAFT_1132817 [Mycena rosella]|uniref:Uncharacterized protein n=1 Tax=Mycena rosella TaxID=1033263 RepID=A0AAD7DLA2_MYCRO|nr:hypothetical protein B0H17DRAFT_1132817 [Mycena rosella]
MRKRLKQRQRRPPSFKSDSKALIKSSKVSTREVLARPPFWVTSRLLALDLSSEEKLKKRTEETHVPQWRWRKEAVASGSIRDDPILPLLVSTMVPVGQIQHAEKKTETLKSGGPVRCLIRAAHQTGEGTCGTKNGIHHADLVASEVSIYCFRGRFLHG